MSEKIVFHLDKVVRSKLPAMMEELGQQPEITILTGIALKRALIRKIAEELSELDPESESYQTELADLKQAVENLLAMSGEEEVEQIRQELLRKKGDFSGGYHIGTLTLASDDAWVEYYRQDPEKYPEEGSVGGEKKFAKGKLFELVHLEQDDGRVFEVARRAPGVRLIIHDEAAGKILLTKEFRRELGEWDYRLPGGKVFDSLDEFEAFRISSNDMANAARTKAIQEAQQEAGVEIADLELYKKSVLGATVEWDLYVFETTNWQLSVEGQELEVGEKIEADNWVTYSEARKMALDGSMQEERIALIFLQWLEKRG